MTTPTTIEGELVLTDENIAEVADALGARAAFSRQGGWVMCKHGVTTRVGRTVFVPCRHVSGEV